MWKQAPDVRSIFAWLNRVLVVECGIVVFAKFLCTYCENLVNFGEELSELSKFLLFKYPIIRYKITGNLYDKYTWRGAYLPPSVVYMLFYPRNIIVHISSIQKMTCFMNTN